MKRIFFVLAAILLLSDLNGQQSFSSLSFGGVVPLGASTGTGSVTTEGYGSTGAVIRLDAAYFPSSYFGLGATLSFGSNKMRKDVLCADLTDYLNSNNLVADQIIDPEYSFSGLDFRSYANLMAGPDFSMRTSQRIYLDFRLLGGFSFFSAPEMKMMISDALHEITTNLKSSQVAPGFTGGLGLRYETPSGFVLRLAADYFHSRTHMIYSFSVPEDSDEVIPSVEASYPVTTLEFTLGIAYSF